MPTAFVPHQRTEVRSILATALTFLVLALVCPWGLASLSFWPSVLAPLLACGPLVRASGTSGSRILAYLHE